MLATAGTGLGRLGKEGKKLDTAAAVGFEGKGAVSLCIGVEVASARAPFSWTRTGARWQGQRNSCYASSGCVRRWRVAR